MAKHPPSVVKTRRRAVGHKLVAAAATFRGQGDALTYALETDETFVEDKERQAVEKVVKHLQACDSSLRKLAKRMGVE